MAKLTPPGWPTPSLKHSQHGLAKNRRKVTRSADEGRAVPELCLIDILVAITRC